MMGPEGDGKRAQGDEPRVLKRKSINLNLDLPHTKVVGSLNYGDYTKHEKEAERKRIRRELDILKDFRTKIEAKIRDRSFGDLPLLDIHPRHAQERLSRQTSLQVSDATPGYKEKRTPKANPAYNHPDFLSGRDKIPLPEKRMKGLAVLKRGTSLVKGGDQDSKRQKVDAARSKRTADIFRMCSTILKRLGSGKGGYWFGKPVDWEGMGLLDYPNIIKQPMDLGTINTKLKDNQYGHPSEFADDVILMYNNAMLFNPPNLDVHILAKQSLQQFKEQYKRVEEKLADDEARSKMEDNELAQAPKDPAIERRLEKIEEMLAANNGSNVPKSAGRAGAALPKPRPHDTQKRQMSFSEKRKLSVNLGKLPGDRLAKVVQIISEQNPGMNNNEEEIELDIDALNNDTLWELERYVANCMKSKNKNKRKIEEGHRDQQAREAGASSGKRVKGGEDDIDIDDDLPSAPANLVEVEKDMREGQTKSSSSGSSSSDESGSSSSGTESGSGSSGSESDNDELHSKDAASKASPQKSAGAVEADVGETEDRGASQVEVPPNVAAVTPAAPPLLTDESALRAALLRGKYADIILKKSMPTHLKNEKIDPKVLEELERKQKEERARLEAEAQAAQLAHKQKEAEAAAEMRRKIEEEREANRRALEEMARTVEIDENRHGLKDLDIMGTKRAGPSANPTSGYARMDERGAVAEVSEENLLEHHGLFMRREDDEDDENGDSDDEGSSSMNDRAGHINGGTALQEANVVLDGSVSTDDKERPKAGDVEVNSAILDKDGDEEVEEGEI